MPGSEAEHILICFTFPTKTLFFLSTARRWLHFQVAGQLFSNKLFAFQRTSRVCDLMFVFLCLVPKSFEISVRMYKQFVEDASAILASKGYKYFRGKKFYFPPPPTIETDLKNQWSASFWKQTNRENAKRWRRSNTERKEGRKERKSYAYRLNFNFEKSPFENCVVCVCHFELLSLRVDEELFDDCCCRCWSSLAFSSRSIWRSTSTATFIRFLLRSLFQCTKYTTPPHNKPDPTNIALAKFDIGCFFRLGSCWCSRCWSNFQSVSVRSS